MAYDIREATYDVPNKTLASGMLLKHVGLSIKIIVLWFSSIAAKCLGLVIFTKD